MKGMMTAKRLRLIEETGIPRDEWIALARQWISCERDREIFVRRCLDSVPCEQAAVEFALTDRQIKTITKRVLQNLIPRSGTSL